MQKRILILRPDFIVDDPDDEGPFRVWPDPADPADVGLDEESSFGGLLCCSSSEATFMYPLMLQTRSSAWEACC